ncbi:helix-turn-helix domain-containing protein [Culturomica massiliensis]|uniref:helix-turn-helix domain-containing protein n=1 Tax=Culturomica massiliensis TaxID=1841857 RepID=UPI00266EA614|nr:helix-turn-helix transcriptional regulator [Culturomica massiliensis]
MLFANKIKVLRESKQILQRHISAALDMDNAMYCKIERGDRRAKKEQVSIIAKLLQINEKQLLILWLADKIIEAIGNEREFANESFNIVQKYIEK